MDHALSEARRRRRAEKAHPLEAWVGRPCGGERDCAALVEDVLRDMGCPLTLPTDRREWVRVPESDVLAFADALADPVKTPQDGDVALMRLRGAQRAYGGHVGVVGLVGGKPWVLHALPGSGSVFHPVRDLRRTRYELAGFYRPRR